MKKEPVVQQTDLSVLILRTILLKRIGYLNTLIIVFGFGIMGTLAYHYISFMDLDRTSRLTFWVIPIGTIIIATLFLSRRNAENKLPYKYTNCRSYRIISDGGTTSCHFAYSSNLNSLIETITDYNILRQIDKDVFDGILPQLAVHFPSQMQLTIPIVTMPAIVVQIRCQCLKKAGLLNLFRTVGINEEPREIITDIVSPRIDTLVSSCTGANRYKTNLINAILMVLVLDSDPAYQQVYNQAGYIITKVDVKLKT